VPVSGNLPNIGTLPEGELAVRLIPVDQDLFLAARARGRPLASRRFSATIRWRTPITNGTANARRSARLLALTGFAGVTGFAHPQSKKLAAPGAVRGGFQRPKKRQDLENCAVPCAGTTREGQRYPVRRGATGSI
jgi:hypothetical protein